MKRQQSGYSLVEVLIALAITSVVLLTVVTLFYMGRRNVYSGKQMTYAVAVGTRAVEDVSQMTHSDVLAAFGLTDGTVLGTTAAVNGQTYANSYMITTASGTPPAIMTNWKAMCTNLANPTVGVIFTPRAPLVAANKFTTAQFMRMRIFVQWDEAQNRRRIAFFDTTKVNRQQ